MKVIAIISALFVPLILFVSYLGRYHWGWSFSKTTEFVTAYGGTTAAFAGFLFIYVNFKEQQKQFERQSFESVLLKLLDHLKKESSKNFPTDQSQGLLPKVKDFTERLNGELKTNKDLEHSRINIIFRDVFDSNRPSEIRTMLALIKFLVRVLVYIEQGKAANKGLYLDLLYGQLTEAEIRAYFYGYFYEGFNLDEEEKAAYRGFFIRYKGRDLIDKNHIKWMN